MHATATANWRDLPSTLDPPAGTFSSISGRGDNCRQCSPSDARHICSTLPRNMLRYAPRDPVDAYVRHAFNPRFDHPSSPLSNRPPIPNIHTSRPISRLIFRRRAKRCHAPSISNSSSPLSAKYWVNLRYRSFLPRRSF